MPKKQSHISTTYQTSHLSMRIRVDVKKAIMSEAKAQHRTVSNLVNVILMEWLSENKA